MTQVYHIWDLRETLLAILAHWLWQQQMHIAELVPEVAFSEGLGLGNLFAQVVIR